MSAAATGLKEGDGARAPVGAGGSLAGSSPAEITRNAALPARLTSLVLAVTGKRGFWKHERTEIARELCGHFLDGLDAGRTPDQLAASFGEPAQTARLMLRAKRRNRPFAWRAAMMSVRALFIFFCTVILLYAALAARYWTGSPTIARDYLKEINAPIEALPLSDRAWPEYRATLMAMGIRSDVEQAVLIDGLDAPPEGGGDANFKATSEQRVAFIHSIRPHLDRLRTASTKPALGYIAGTSVDEAFDAATSPFYKPRDPSAPPGSSPAPDATDDNLPLINVLLPHLGETRRMVRLFRLDCLLAAREGDGPRAAQSIEAMLRIAHHSKEFPSLISDLVSAAELSRAAQTLGEVIESHPALIADADLVRLSHAFGTYNGGAPLKMSLAGEQAMFADLLQRAFTDDGRGNGRLAPGALHLLESLQENQTTLLSEGRALQAVGPMAMLAVADRTSQMREYATHMNAESDWLAIPPWQRGDKPPERILGEHSLSPVWRARYMPVSIMLPALSKAGATLERAAVERDAACAVIALELHRRRAGSYPAALAEVEPSLLPKAPVDPFDGHPIKYRLVDGKPVLYSIGTDRKDDRGLPPPGDDGNATASKWLTPASAAARLKAPPRGGDASIDGDWVLWPPSRQKRAA